MKVLLFFTALCLVSRVSSQPVSESVLFDNYVSTADNDFVNRFDNGTGLNQIQTNGITGGCLETPQTISWGNDNAIYCTRYKGQIGTGWDRIAIARFPGGNGVMRCNL